MSPEPAAAAPGPWGEVEVRPGVRLRFVDRRPADDAEDAGRSRTPVLMVHGNPTSSFYFRDLIARLAATRRVVAPDHVGMGRSDRPPESRYPYGLESRVQDLETLWRSLGEERVDLVVHDWGGMIGFAWALRDPGRIRRIVAMNTAAFPLPAGRRVPWQLRVARQPVLGALLVRGLGLFARGAVRQCVARAPLAPEVAAGYLEPIRGWRRSLAVHRFVQDIPLSEGHPSWVTVSETARRLPELRDRPLLVCWGRRDFVFDDAFLADWRRRCPWARFHEVADAGHFLLEDAGDEVGAVVERFLDEVPERDPEAGGGSEHAAASGSGPRGPEPSACHAEGHDS